MYEKKKVLLAEHEQNIKEILLYLLKAWDYDVRVVSDGDSVLNVVRHSQPDIIIVDSNLPNMSGLKVLRALKEDFLTSHIPTVILIDKRQIRKKMLEIEQGVDDYIISPPDPIDLEVRLQMAMRRTDHQLHANALTKLPGNRYIEKIIVSKIETSEPFSVLYYDIDNFKSFNDEYGYIKGDNVIRHTAYIISRTVKRCGAPGDFIGHIGGDDFVVVTTPNTDEKIAKDSILSFDRLMPFHYKNEDRKNGCIETKDRQGNLSKIPLMSISVAIANNINYKFQNIIELMEIIAEIKRYLKGLPGSNFLINRRQVMEKEGDSMPRDLGLRSTSLGEGPQYRPLGQILLEEGILTQEQLELALKRHWSTGQQVGESILDLGLAFSEDISQALEIQRDGKKKRR